MEKTRLENELMEVIIPELIEAKRRVNELERLERAYNRRLNELYSQEEEDNDK